MESAPTRTVAPRRRRRLFGPLLYGTLALGLAELVGLWCYGQWPRWQRWIEIRQLAAQLGDPSKAVRDKAAHELAMIQSGTWGPVRDALYSGEDCVRLSACEVVLHTDASPHEKTQALIRALADKRPEIRAMAARQLGLAQRELPEVEFDQVAASEALLATLRDTSTLVVVESLRTLIGLERQLPGAISDLELGLLASDPQVRYYSARALNRAERRMRPEVEQCLWKMIREPRRYTSGVRHWAARELLDSQPSSRSELSRTIARLALSRNRSMRLEMLSLLEYIASIEPGTVRERSTMSSAIPVLIYLACTEIGETQRRVVILMDIINPRSVLWVLPILLKTYLFARPGTEEDYWSRSYLQRQVPLRLPWTWDRVRAIVADYVRNWFGVELTPP